MGDIEVLTLPLKIPDTMAEIRRIRVKPLSQGSGDLNRLVIPGDTITSDSDYMRGHGTYFEDSKLQASVAGVVETVNKLIHVNPMKTRYNGEVGDVVVGRVVEVSQNRWKLDTNSRLHSVLMLSSVNLPGGELRRRSAKDELNMREYLQEGDLVSAEVQSVFGDGSLSLHTRSLKYGKLGQGVLVKVSPMIVKRSKTHMHNLSCGASVILGNNGYIWICPIVNQEENIHGGGFIQNLDPIPMEDREVIVRLRNCIVGLASRNLMLFDTCILYTYESSMRYTASELLVPENMESVVEETLQRLEQEGAA